MSSVNLRPNGTVNNTGAVTGAASAHAALSDDSDSSYIFFDPDEAATFDLDNSSVPAGSPIRRIVLVARCERSGSGYIHLYSEIYTVPDTDRSGEQNVQIVPTSITTSYANVWYVNGLGLGDSELDSLQAHIGALGSAHLVVYELYVAVQYVAEPTVVVNLPTGTVTENLIQVEWTPTLDGDGGNLYRSEVVITATGDDPETDAILSGIAGPVTETYKFLEQLPDGVYDAHVRVAQLVDGVEYWSDRDSSTFTVDAIGPGVPTVTLTPQSAQGRVKIELHDTAGDTATLGYSLQRAVGDDWIAVRAPADGLVGSDIIAYDMEAPNGEDATYRARAIGSGFVVSAWAEETTSWSSSDWRLKHPTDTTLSIVARMRSYPGSASLIRNATHWVLGRRDPVVISEVPGLPAGDLQIRCDTYEERQALDALIVSTTPLLLQGPVSERDDDRWIIFTAAARERIVDKAWIPETWETLPWQEVARPDGDLVAWPDEGDDDAEDLVLG